jgi:hypothetical protein
VHPAPQRGVALDGSPVDFATMADLEDCNDFLSVVDCVDDSVVALPHSVSIVVSGELLAPGRARLFGEGLNSDDETSAVGLLSNRFQFLRSRTLDVDSISCQAVSSP